MRKAIILLMLFILTIFAYAQENDKIIFDNRKNEFVISLESIALADYDNFIKTNRVVNISRGFSSKKGNTVVHLKITPSRELTGVKIYEEISKDVAEHVNDIKFTNNPEVIKADPLVVWRLEKMDEPLEFEYEVNKKIDEISQEEFTAVVIADEIGEKLSPKKGIFNNWITIIVLVIILVSFSIFFVRADFSKKSEKPPTQQQEPPLQKPDMQPYRVAPPGYSPKQFFNKKSVKEKIAKERERIREIFK